MTSNKGDAKQAFNEAVQSQTQEPKKSEGSRMVAQDQPVPHPRPPAIGKVVDANTFRERWNGERATANSGDSFALIERKSEHLSVRDNFNMRSDEVSAAEHHLIDSEERLASAIDAYLQAYEKAQPIPPSLTARIDRLHHETVKSEQHVDALRDTGRTLDKPLRLGDAFDRADQLHQRQKDQERS